MGRSKRKLANNNKSVFVIHDIIDAMNCLQYLRASKYRDCSQVLIIFQVRLVKRGKEQHSQQVGNDIIDLLQPWLGEKCICLCDYCLPGITSSSNCCSLCGFGVLKVAFDIKSDLKVNSVIPITSVACFLASKFPEMMKRKVEVQLSSIDLHTRTPPQVTTEDDTP